MKVSRRFARRFHLLALLRAGLVAGAIYDLVFAIAMVVGPAAVADRLGLPLPGTRFYLWLMAIFLIMLASLYVAAARDPRRYSVIVVVAIVGRMAGAIAFAAAAVADPALGGLWLLAGADLFFAVLHGATWMPLVT